MPHDGQRNTLADFFFVAMSLNLPIDILAPSLDAGASSMMTV
jgi:hypothetical protein